MPSPRTHRRPPKHLYRWLVTTIESCLNVRRTRPLIERKAPRGIGGKIESALLFQAIEQPDTLCAFGAELWKIHFERQEWHRRRKTTQNARFESLDVNLDEMRNAIIPDQ